MSRSAFSYGFGALVLAIAACQRVAPAAALPQASGADGAIASAEASRVAEAAYMLHDFPAAETHYREVLSTDPSPEQQTSAAIALANIAWRVRQDTASARSFLHRAASTDAREAAVSLELARMRLAFGDFAGAHAATREALVFAAESLEESRVVSLLAETLIEPILQRLDPASAPLIVREAERSALREVLPLLTHVVSHGAATGSLRRCASGAFGGREAEGEDPAHGGGPAGAQLPDSAEGPGHADEEPRPRRRQRHLRAARATHTP